VPRAALWASEAATVLTIQLRVASRSALFPRTGSNALAVLFVAEGRLLLHDMQRLDASISVVAVHLPNAFALAAPSRAALLSKVPINCLAVRSILGPCLSTRTSADPAVRLPCCSATTSAPRIGDWSTIHSILGMYFNLVQP
jgi:hypothetical protein